MSELKHFGVPGMRWGHRKQQSKSSGNYKGKAESLISKHSKSKASALVAETKTDSFGQKILKAYDIKKDKKGKYHIGNWTGIKIAGTLVAADFVQAYTIATVRNLTSGYYAYAIKSGKGPKWIGDLAWTLGKIKSNTPLR